MKVTDITIADFKSLFRRDFPYLPVWNMDSFYNTDEEVYFDATRLFYKALSDGVESTPNTVADWIKIIDNLDNYILDEDLTNSLTMAQSVFNPDLWPEDSIFKGAFLYLTAHYLCLDIRTSQKGVMSKGEFVTASKGVGNVSESFAIPEQFLKDPVLSYYTKTNYGLKYLSLLIPFLVGNTGIAYGATTA